MHSSLPGSGQDVYHVRFAWCQTVSAVAEELAEKFDEETDPGEATTQEEDAFEVEESGPGTVAGVTFALEAGMTEEDDNSATFHTSEEFSSEQATRAITALAMPQAKTDFIKYFFINIPHSKVFNLFVNIYFFKSVTNFLYSVHKKRTRFRVPFLAVSNEVALLWAMSNEACVLLNWIFRDAQDDGSQSEWNERAHTSKGVSPCSYLKAA